MQNTSFNHSVKVPKLYKCAAKICQEVAGGGGSIKQLVYEKTHFNTKALYALVVTTFQKAKEIDLLLTRTKLLEKEPRLDPWLAKILISEVLWGKKQLPKSDAKPIQAILAYEQAFHAHLSDSPGDTTAANTENHKKPRYVRVNTLINPFNEALELFQNEGWILQKPKNQNDYEGFLEQVSNLEGDFMLKDLHIPDMLIFPGGTEFYNHPGYKKGAIILQDKASCLPVHLLSPPPGSVVLDMCAAPGMKTTQLATMLQNEGTIYAVEQDPKRFEVLNKMIESLGATCVKTINKDVLQCGDRNFPGVEYVLVDPSCSASGMTDRLAIQQNRDQSRLQKLAGFQIKILRSAFTRYPKVKKIVYSTCSLYPEENEDVVRQVLETNNQFKLVPAAEFINKSWKNFGSPDFGDIGKYCLYAKPEEDFTNGFFVAVFERLEEGENNQFFNGRVLNYRKNVDKKQARKERKFREKVEGEDNFDKIIEEKKKGNYLPEIGVNTDDVEDSNIYDEVIDKNTAEVLKQKKQNKRHGEVLDQTSNEFTKKHKKKKKKHGDVIDLTLTGDGNQETGNCHVEKGLKNEEIMIPLKKNRKKPKDSEQCENVKQTYENNVGLVNDITGNESKAEENMENKKKKKKKRKFVDTDENSEHINYENGGQNNNTKNSERDVSHKNDEFIKRDKKKKNKHSSELINLKQTQKAAQETIDDFTKEDLDSVYNENDKSLKKIKKKKKYEKDEKSNKSNKEKKDLTTNHLNKGFENMDQDAADKLINELTKKSKKKKDKYAEVDKSTQFTEEPSEETNDNSLVKRKVRGKSGSTVHWKIHRKS